MDVAPVYHLNRATCARPPGAGRKSGAAGRGGRRPATVDALPPRLGGRTCGSWRDCIPVARRCTGGDGEIFRHDTTSLRATAPLPPPGPHPLNTPIPPQRRAHRAARWACISLRLASLTGCFWRYSARNAHTDWRRRRHLPPPPDKQRHDSAMTSGSTSSPQLAVFSTGI